MKTYEDKDASSLTVILILARAFIAAIVGIVQDAKPSKEQIAQPRPRTSFLDPDTPGPGASHIP